MPLWRSGAWPDAAFPYASDRAWLAPPTCSSPLDGEPLNAPNKISLTVHPPGKGDRAGNGRPATFSLAVGVILVWLVTGPLFHFSDTWQLVITTGTTIITFLMVFLIQVTPNRDAEAPTGCLHGTPSDVVYALL